MALDLSSLQKAVHSLERAIEFTSPLLKGAVDTDQKHVLRAGVIQNFEFTYELCWKFMKRWLDVNSGSAVVDGATRKEMFRLAAESQLIDDAQVWFEYTRFRNETAHTYDEETAEDVYKAAVRFVKDARGLLKTIEGKND